MSYFEFNARGQECGVRKKTGGRKWEGGRRERTGRTTAVGGIGAGRADGPQSRARVQFRV